MYRAVWQLAAQPIAKGLLSQEKGNNRVRKSLSVPVCVRVQHTWGQCMCIWCVYACLRQKDAPHAARIHPSVYWKMAPHAACIDVLRQSN